MTDRIMKCIIDTNFVNNSFNQFDNEKLVIQELFSERHKCSVTVAIIFIWIDTSGIKAGIKMKYSFLGSIYNPLHQFMHNRQVIHKRFCSYCIFTHITEHAMSSLVQAVTKCW